MKKIFFSTLLALISFIGLSQSSNSGAIKFLGIPIDGTESQFVAKLKNKGFTYNSQYESYKGQFNGKTVDVYIHTNHDIVDRVYVAFPYTSEENIRAEYNRLLKQFNENKKYMNLSLSDEIPEDDDISYEISVNNKRYQASFSYFDEDGDQLEFVYAIIDGFSDFFTEEERNAMKDNIKQYVSASEEGRDKIMEQVIAEMQKTEFAQTSGNTEEDTEKAYRFLVTALDTIRSLADGDVWFMIHNHYGQYRIGLYYDNLHNQANGEDL